MTLDEAAVFLSGGTPKKGVSEYWDGDIPWFSAANMEHRFLLQSEITLTNKGLQAGSKLAPAGATLLLVRGSGLFNHIPICFADREVAFNQDVKAIVAREHVDPVFLHFWIEALRPTLQKNIGVTGIGAGKFDTDFLKALPFPQIPKQQQIEIAAYASSFDRKIELNRKTNETLEAMAQAIFRDWFVDFGPVRRKMGGASEPSAILGSLLPPDAPMASEIAGLFPDRLGDNGLPEGWDRTTVKSIAKNVSNGGTPKRSMPCYWNNGNVPWLTSGEVRQRFVLATENFISTEGLRNSSAKMLPAGCILVALYRATAGQISFNIEPLSTNQAVCAVEPEQNSQFFLLLSLRRMVQKLSESAVGSA